MLEVVRVLTQTVKNCPVLVGEAGVGKTAVVEGLASRIAQGRAPTPIVGKRIIQLDLAGLVAGTQYRGEFEQRLQTVLQEAADSPEVILFLDELHTVVGAGSGGGGPMDAANILKPSLGRGKVRLIGATTLDEYRKHIEKDPALERRFEPIVVAEPTAAEALGILLGIRERLQQHHKVTIQTDDLEASVFLAVKHLRDRRLPDKAIDLVEKACSGVAVRWTSAIPGEEEGPQTPGIVTAHEVARVVAQRTGIPIAELTQDERQRLSDLADELKRRVIGQDEACDAVAQAVRRARLGLKADDRPIGVLLLVGPTGVGKTELARATAACVFGGAEKLVRLDMSEFMEKHTVARLTGAPPGYVGHDEEGQLTGALRRTPHCVVLLDEIEKAHADVLSLFLQVFDAGRLTDASGRTADASNALFLLASNLPMEGGMGFEPAVPSEAQAREILLLRHNLRPELVNRLDRVIVFHRLEAAHVRRICAGLLEEVHEQLQKQRVGLEWDEEALAFLARAGHSDTFGARELRRVIERQVKVRIAAGIPQQQIQRGQVVHLRVREGELELSLSW